MRRLAAVMVAGAVMMGCHHDAPEKEKPTTMPTLYGTAGQAPIAVEARSTPVQEGEPPLAYRVESNVTIRIVDTTANQPIAMQAMKAGEFVAVTQDNGVVMGDERVVKGPLPEGHRYEIYVEQPSKNIFRSGAVIPGPR
jgi:hypothetical protein